MLAVVFVGGLVIQLTGKKLLKHLNLMLSFGGAYLIGLIFLHLVPEVFGATFDDTFTVRTAGWFVLGGFMLQVFLEYLSQGVEHGHYHEHAVSKGFPLMIFISLCLHALIEAMPLAGGLHDHDHGHVHMHLDGDSLLIGLLIHKLPVAFVLAGMLLSSGISAAKRWIYLAVFALMPVVGMYLSDLLIHANAFDANVVMVSLSAMLIGILFHISTTILFETSNGHRFNIQKLTVVILGMLIAAMTL
ncbi:MAG: ZIP family metal transporter [Flavobacteriales bacterium]|nr:ZIP family metal transporter [Flavobacteriales bacterium]